MARTPTSAPPVPVPMQQPAVPMIQTTKPRLLEAIAAASSSFGDLIKDSKNDYLKSQYLALPGLLKAIKPALLEQRVAIYSQVLADNGAWVVRTTLAFVDGTEELSSDFPIPDPSNSQRIGAAVTYGTRYNLLALLAVCPESDDDGNNGNFGSAPVAAQGLPGLPSGQGLTAQWPAPGQYVQPMQPAPMPPAIAYPNQPLPVLPQ